MPVNSIDDVNANYATPEGADITARIEQRAERLVNDIEYDESLLDGTGFSLDDYEDDPDEVARAIAKTELVGDASKGVVYPLKLKTRDFAVIDGRNSTKLNQPDYRGQAEADIHIDDYDDEWDYEDALNDRMQELADESEDSIYNRVVNALQESDLYQDESAIESVMAELQDYLYDDQIDLSTIDEAIRSNVMDAYDDSGEALSSGEISRQVIQNLGFKGIIDKTVNRKFGSQRQFGQSMAGMDEDTIHYIVFPENENLIRSINADFDPEQYGSRNILYGIGGGALGVGALTQAQDEGETKYE